MNIVAVEKSVGTYELKYPRVLVIPLKVETHFDSCDDTIMRASTRQYAKVARVDVVENGVESSIRETELEKKVPENGEASRYGDVGAMLAKKSCIHPDSSGFQYTSRIQSADTLSIASLSLSDNFGPEPSGFPLPCDRCKNRDAVVVHHGGPTGETDRKILPLPCKCSIATFSGLTQKTLIDVENCVDIWQQKTAKQSPLVPRENLTTNDIRDNIEAEIHAREHLEIKNEQSDEFQSKKVTEKRLSVSRVKSRFVNCSVPRKVGVVKAPVAEKNPRNKRFSAKNEVDDAFEKKSRRKRKIMNDDSGLATPESSLVTQETTDDDKQKSRPAHLRVRFVKHRPIGVVPASAENASDAPKWIAKPVTKELSIPLRAPRRKRVNATNEENNNEQTKVLSAKQIAFNQIMLNLLNKANVDQLQSLPLIGIKTARSIFQYRKLNGSFKSFKDLEKIPIWSQTVWKKFLAANNVLLE